MTLREAILESYHNATEDDPATKSEFDAMPADEWAYDLWMKAGVIDDGGWSLEEITAEVVVMREEKVFG